MTVPTTSTTRQQAELATSRRLLAAAVNEGLVSCRHVAAAAAPLALRLSPQSQSQSPWQPNDTDEEQSPFAHEWIEATLVPERAAQLHSPDTTAVLRALDALDLAPAAALTLHTGEAVTHPAVLLATLARWLGIPQEAVVRLGDELSNSADNQYLAFEHQRQRQGQRTQLSLLNSTAIEWEQAIVEGHPSHPLHRTKLGLSPAQVVAWSSEYAARLPVRFVALPRANVVVVNDYEARLAAWLPSETVAATPADHVVIPVHPGQLDKIRLVAPTAVVLPGSQDVDAQTSVRSVHPVAQPGFDLKLSLAIHTTSAVRTISPQSVHNGSRVVAALRPIVPSTLVLIDEPAAAALKHEDDAVAKHLACILRDDPTSNLAKGERLIVAGSLNETDRSIAKAATPLVISAFGLDTRAKRLAFLDEYVRVFLDTFVPPLRDHGVAFEAHGQNVLVRVDAATGSVKGFAVRDFGGVKIHQATFAATSPDRKPIELFPGSTITADTLYEANAKLFHTGVQHHLHYLVRSLGLHFDGSGWEIVRHHARRVLLGKGEMFSWWMEPTVEFKRLLTMRLENTPYDVSAIKFKKFI